MSMNLGMEDVWLHVNLGMKNAWLHMNLGGENAWLHVNSGVEGSWLHVNSGVEGSGVGRAAAAVTLPTVMKRGELSAALLCTFICLPAKVEPLYFILFHQERT